MVTGKNKEQFEKWLENQCKQMNYNICQWNDFDLEIWEQKDFRMKIGVYLAYYDSLNKFITVDLKNSNSWKYEIFTKDDIIEDIEFIDRNEAYKEAFKKANDLINNN